MMNRFTIPREIVVADDEATPKPEHVPFETISISADESTVYQGTTVSGNVEQEEEEDCGIGGFAIFWIFVLLLGLAVILPKDSISTFLSSSVTPENPILAMENSPNVPTLRPTRRPSAPSRKPTRERPKSQPTIPVSQPQKTPDTNPTVTSSGWPLFKHESDESNSSFSTQTSVRPTRTPFTSPPRTPSFSPSEFPTHSPTTKQVDSLMDMNSDHSLIGSHHRPREYEEFSFYALGDIPYDNRDVQTLQNQVRDLNNVYLNDKAKFVVHVGDMQSGMDSKCEQSFYARVQKIFVDESPLPTMVLAGDNDWNNCPSPPVAWYNYASHFIGLEQLWTSGEEISIERWNEQRPENFVSFVNGVVVLSVNLVGLPLLSPTEWDKRTADNVLWVRNNVNSYFRTEEDIRAVVIFGHSRYRGEIHPFFTGIRSIFMSDASTYRTGLNIPVIYLHGDGHHFEISSIPSLNWDQFNTVMVDQGKNAPPIKVEIAGKNDLGIEGENQYVLGNGLIRIDRRGGLYT
eukprot:scaffold66660_cov58-Attheya_sp.AAC.3